MYDAPKVIAGILVLLALGGLPIWANLGSAKQVKQPELQKPLGDACVLDRAAIRATHMDLLNRWRDEVVREQLRNPVRAGTREVPKSLSEGCMRCHTSKAEFCDRCHNWFGVDPYCWNCHVEPKGGLR